MKGIVLAGGSGTRLMPLTKVISKQLLPIYDKPMIYYPISVLMLAGIQDILIISAPNQIEAFKSLLGNGSQFGVRLQYKVQPQPDGIAQAFILGENFLNGDDVCLVLGDNIFYGHGLRALLRKAASAGQSATIFGYHINDPQNFGVIEFDEDGKAISIEEKPASPKSNYAVTGLYFYDNKVVEISKGLRKSSRGELEITDINTAYLQRQELKVEILGRGMAWLDTGTHSSLLEAGNFVQTIESRQGLKIACLEEIGFNNGWISISELSASTSMYGENSYAKHLQKIIKLQKKII